MHHHTSPCTTIHHFVCPLQEDLYSWMADRQARDQFSIRAGSDTLVLWNDGRRGRSDDVYKRENWTESFVQWSPHGSMLATMHTKGVAVWGGASFKRLQRFQHDQPQLIDFSPNERFLLTYSSIEPRVRKEGQWGA